MNYDKEYVEYLMSLSVEDFDRLCYEMTLSEVNESIKAIQYHRKELMLQEAELIDEDYIPEKITDLKEANEIIQRIKNL